MINNDIELLAPVGNKEALLAAIENGANAVYLGGKLFNARQFANNFDYKELEEAVKYAHVRGVKVYVTVNILIDDSEMREAIEYIRFLYNIDVDGLIVQDLGLARLVHKIFPDFDLHGSTQMTINNLPGALYLEELGFKRVILARETPIREIENIYNGSNIELEAFVHGALCMSYSGQCLMSSIFGGRSGNRGKCAQPCRMPYSIIDRETTMPAFTKFNKKYLLSPKDLNTLDNIQDIIDSGIISLKIEGRMKRPEYVATIVKNYRKALDKGPESISEEDRNDILQIFNRGFTEGLMTGAFGKDFLSYERPDNRGVVVGEISRNFGDYVEIELSKDVDQGDGIALETTKGDYVGLNLDESSTKGSTIRIEKKGNLSLNSKVYRTSSSKLLKKAKESYEGRNVQFPINMQVIIEKEKAAELIIEYNGENYKVKSDFIVEESKNVPLTKEKVIEQLSKLNDTAYYINKIEINLDSDSFMPISQVNGLRRDGIKKIEDIARKFNYREEISDKDFNERIAENFNESRIRNKEKNLVSISVLKSEQFKKLDLNKLDRIYIGFSYGIEDAIEKCKEKKVEVYVLTDKILYSGDLKLLKEKINPIEDLIDGISVSNLGTLQFVKDNFNLKIHGDIGLNVFNSFTVSQLKDSDLDGVTLSPELNMKQIGNISDRESIVYETIGYGYLPLMVTKHCPMSIVKACKDDLNCENCSYSNSYALKDRKNMNFNMERRNGQTLIYNSVALMVADNLDKIYSNGVNMIRLDFTFETENIRQIQEIFYDFAKGLTSKEKVIDFINDYRYKNDITRGHYFRGVI